MSRTVLKERVFTSTGRSLGSFSAVDLEPFEMTYIESDEPVPELPPGFKPEDKGGRKRVPDPVDNNRLEPENKGNQQQGKGIDPFSKGGKGEDRENKPPETWDPNGTDIDDMEKANTPEEPEPTQGGGSTGGSNTSGGQGSQNNQGDSSNGNNQSDSSEEGSQGNKGETQQGQQGSKSGGQTSKGQSDSGESDLEDALDDINKSLEKTAKDIADRIKNGELDSEQAIEDAIRDALEKAADDIANKTGLNRDDINDTLQDALDDVIERAKEKSQGKNSDGKIGDKSDSSSESDQGDDSDNDFNSSNNGGSKGESGSSSKGGAGGSGEAHNSTRKGIEKLLDADDEEEDDEPIEKSAMEKAIEKANNSRSSSEKKKEEDDKSFEAETRKTQDRKSPTERREEIQKTGDMIREAIGEAKKDLAERKQKGEIDENEDSELDTLFRAGASKLTNVGNGKMKSDWKSKLERVLTTAAGMKIKMNPNLINKRIEDAPPGREDIVPEIANIAILIDQSGSMGATKFKQVIIHIDTILSAKKLGNVKFHIIGWGSGSLTDVAKTYTKCKGRNLKQTMLSKFSDTPWGTEIIPAFQVAAKLLKKPDAIMIFTDADAWDYNKVQRDPICSRFLTKHKGKIIWVLTADANKSKVKEMDPYSYQHDMYIKFKKGK